MHWNILVLLVNNVPEASPQIFVNACLLVLYKDANKRFAQK